MVSRAFLDNSMGEQLTDNLAESRMAEFAALGNPETPGRSFRRSTLHRARTIRVMLLKTRSDSYHGPRAA